MALRGRLAAARGAWLVFEDEAGFSMTQVRGRSRRRVSIAALTCYKPASYGSS
ncbi:hypothetical protein AB0N81_36450 [Streptomyces sp. NPDC093510]|uniref:hypothetical protein n=1 Tax=Streptomyces sp. NPDC093510 TaxID=3155199 RepID=UPI0034229FCC